MVAICLRLVFLSKLRSLCCVAGGHHRCEVREQLVCVPANVFCLVISPLVSGFILQNDFFRMRPMPKQRSHSTSTARVAMVRDTGAMERSCAACSACSCNS